MKTQCRKRGFIHCQRPGSEGGPDLFTVSARARRGVDPTKKTLGEAFRSPLRASGIPPESLRPVLHSRTQGEGG